jgi:hypothetical protein
MSTRSTDRDDAQPASSNFCAVAGEHDFGSLAASARSSSLAPLAGSDTGGMDLSKQKIS